MPEVAERAESPTALARVRAGLTGKIARYGAGSVVATVCSQATFLLVYGPLGASTTLASVLAWFAGAIPNYWINRTWAWGRRGRPSLRKELLPYAAIVLGTLLLAVLATAAAAHILDGTSVSHSGRTFLVSGTYFMVYAVMFVVRFVLFDRLFTGRRAALGTEAGV
jgi:putative flippase GtrA